MPTKPDLLNGLPEEIILLIAGYINDSWTSYSKRPALWSMASVNRKMYGICRPLLWEKLNFPPHLDPRSVAYLTDVLLPEIGRAVRSIALVLSKEPDDVVNSDSASFLNPNNRASLAGTPRTTTHYYTRHRQWLSHQSAINIVSQCPNLQGLDLGLTWRFFESEQVICNALDALLPALISDMHHLQHLGLDFTDHSSGAADAVFRTLSKLPHLTSFACRNMIDGRTTEQTLKFGRAISGLKKLTTLYLSQVGFILLDTSGLSLPNLTHLTLEEYEQVQPLRAAYSVNMLAPNLTHLILKFQGGLSKRIPESDSSFVSLVFHLPLLTYLSLSEMGLFDTVEYLLIDRFQHCQRIRHLAYYPIQHMVFPKLVELVRASTWPRLETLAVPGYVKRPPISDLESYPQLVDFCKQAAIHLEFVKS